MNEPLNKQHFRNVLPYCSKKMEGVKLRSIIMSLRAFHKSLAFKLLSVRKPKIIHYFVRLLSCDQSFLWNSEESS